MTQRIVSVGDDFALPAGTKVLDTHLPARLGTTALNATIAAQTVGKLDKSAAAPTVLGSGLVSPLLGRSLVGFYAALSQRSARPVNVLVLGDSISEGFGASSREDRYVGRLMANLKHQYSVAGVTGGAGYLPAWYASPNMAPLGPTLSGNAVKNGEGARGLGLRAVTLGADTGSGLGSLTFTFTGTSFDMLAAQRIATGTDSVRIVIDGAPYVEWEVVDGTGTSVWNSGPLTAGSHTVTVTARFGAPSIEGFMLYNGDETKGLRLWEGAKSGTRADQFSAASGGNSNWASSITVVNPDLVVIAWMTNDINSKTSAEYATSLRNVADLVRSKKANVPFLFMAMFERGTNGLEPWANYVEAMRTVASEYANAAFFDLGTHIPKLAGTGGADHYGLLSDGVHPTPLGHGLIGDSITSHLSMNGPASVSGAVVVPPAPGYTPYSLGVTGENHRYVADQFTNPDGSIISSWPDLVASGGSAIGATNVPLGTQAGHRFVSAGAGTPALTGSVAMAGPLTVAMVVRRKGTGLIALELANYRIRAAASALTWQASGTGSTTLTGSDTTVWAVVIARLDGANSKLFVNGTSPATMGITGPAASGVSDVIRSAFGTTDAASFAELVTFPTALTDGQIATLQASMSAQYGALIGQA